MLYFIVADKKMTDLIILLFLVEHNSPILSLIFFHSSDQFIIATVRSCVV